MSINVEIEQCLIGDILFSKKIRAIDLSIKTGMSTSQISKYINGSRCMSIKSAKTMAVALNCKIDDLYQFKIY